MNHAPRGATPGRRRPTMTDVAELAGVSQTTVSLVLNGAAKARLAAETRDRVARAATTLGYAFVPRPVMPPSSEPGLVGFVVDQMATDPWCALALDGIRSLASERGFTVLAAVTGGDSGSEASVLAQLAALPLTGLIYGRIHTTAIDPPAALVRGRTVLLNCYAKDRSLPAVVPGEVGAGHAATDRLLRAGHTRIGFINGETWMDASRDRLKGYRQALATADLPFDPDLVRIGNWQPSSGYDATLDLMRAKAPSAIFCANDLMALGCLAALHDLGVKVPEDVSVMGFDDREIALHARPPLTTMILPHFEMGVRAADILLEAPGTAALRPVHVKVECPLVERQSVGNVQPSGRRRPGVAQRTEGPSAS